MCTHSYWGNFILLCIMVSSGVLAAEDPLRAQSPRNEVRLRHVIMPPAVGGALSDSTAIRPSVCFSLGYRNAGCVAQLPRL